MADLFESQHQEIERRALEIWKARQADFPAFVRRMKPDDLDRASGAWDRALVLAAIELGYLTP